MNNYKFIQNFYNFHNNKINSCNLSYILKKFYAIRIIRKQAIFFINVKFHRFTIFLIFIKIYLLI